MKRMRTPGACCERPLGHTPSGIGARGPMRTPLSPGGFLYLGALGGRILGSTGPAQKERDATGELGILGAPIGYTERMPVPSLLSEIRADRLALRRVEASTRAQSVLQFLTKRGIQARIIGSLADGRFALHSDVDFLITHLPDPRLRYAIEGDVEDIMGPIPFDVVYQDEVTWA